MVLLSPMELDTTMRMILQVPIWAQRVIYIQGSCLKDNDLTRARMNEAEACFVLAARNYADKTAADEHTILRSVKPQKLPINTFKDKPNVMVKKTRRIIDLKYNSYVSIIIKRPFYKRREVYIRIHVCKNKT